MASFQAKIGQEKLGKSKKKKNRSNEFLPDPEQRIPKKQQKNFKKLKNTIMASFQAKLRWDRTGKNVNKKNKKKVKKKKTVPMSSYPTRN